MEDRQTWRELLGKIVSDPLERQRLSEKLKINPITLARWTTHRSNPREDTLRSLIEALPQYRKQLVELITKEYPNFLSDGSPVVADLQQGIPSEFYIRALNAHATTIPILRISTICILVLQQMVGHLDPHQLGLLATIVQCVPPAPGEKQVRSLRKTFTRGFLPWKNLQEHQTYFSGTESLTGYALLSGHHMIANSTDKMDQLSAHADIKRKGSALASPILHTDRTIGCLYIFTVQPNYFTQNHLDLIKRYTDLITLAFGPEEFYHLNDIRLGMMPPFEKQQSLLGSFQQRVIRTMLRAQQNHQPMTRPIAEAQVWKELEEELLHLPCDPIQP